jgi:hypothetical protein
MMKDLNSFIRPLLEFLNGVFHRAVPVIQHGSPFLYPLGCCLFYHKGILTPDDQEKNGMAVAPKKNPSACYNPIRT